MKKRHLKKKKYFITINMLNNRHRSQCCHAQKRAGRISDERYVFNPRRRWTRRTTKDDDDRQQSEMMRREMAELCIRIIIEVDFHWFYIVDCRHIVDFWQSWGGNCLPSTFFESHRILPFHHRYFDSTPKRQAASNNNSEMTSTTTTSSFHYSTIMYSILIE